MMSGDTVDGRNPKQPPDIYETCRKSWDKPINYQPQLVSLPDFWWPSTGIIPKRCICIVYSPALRFVLPAHCRGYRLPVPFCWAEVCRCAKWLGSYLQGWMVGSCRCDIDVMFTLLETNSSHLKMDGWNTIRFLLGPGLFSEANC